VNLGPIYQPEGELTYNFHLQDISTLGATPPGYDFPTLRYNGYNESDHICSNTFAGGLSPNCKSNNGHSAASGCVVTSSAFNICSRGELGGSSADQWSINQRKKITNVVNGAL